MIMIASTMACKDSTNRTLSPPPHPGLIVSSYAG
jgi:hypothetical protein